MIKRVFLWFALVTLLLNVCPTQAAENFPNFPMSFYGQVTINGTAAPVGTKIRAYYNELTLLAGEITTTDSGLYGADAPTAAKLVVASGTGAITFVVEQNESFTAGNPIITYPNFTAGEAVNLTLNFQTLSGCSATTWSPDPATICSGQTFTQTSNCSTVRSMTGTKTCTTSMGGGGSSSGTTSSVTIKLPAVKTGSGLTLVTGTGSGTTLETGSGSTNSGSGTVLVDFPDTAGHWAQNYIAKLVKLGVVSGKADGLYHPNDPISRAEYLKIVLKTLKIKIETTRLTQFVDVPADAWYIGYLATAYARGIVQGKDKTHFNPNDQVTRAEALKIVFNTLGLSLSNGETPFKDVSFIDWFNKYVYWGYKYGLVSGRTATWFAPNDSLTRAEAAKIMIRLLEFKP